MFACWDWVGFNTLGACFLLPTESASKACFCPPLRGGGHGRGRVLRGSRRLGRPGEGILVRWHRFLSFFGFVPGLFPFDALATRGLRRNFENGFLRRKVRTTRRSASRRPKGRAKRKARASGLGGSGGLCGLGVCLLVCPCFWQGICTTDVCVCVCARACVFGRFYFKLSHACFVHGPHRRGLRHHSF